MAIVRRGERAGPRRRHRRRDRRLQRGLPPRRWPAGPTSLLVEKAQLTAGSTCQAAGLVTAFNPSATMMAFRRYSIELYRRLGAFGDVGSLRLASSPGSAQGARAHRQPGPRDRPRRRRDRGRGGAPADARDLAGFALRGRPPGRRRPSRSPQGDPCPGRRGAGARASGSAGRPGDRLRAVAARDPPRPHR